MCIFVVMEKIFCALFFIDTFCPDHILPFCYTVNLNFSWMKNILVYIHRYKWKIGSSKVFTLHLLVNCGLNTCLNIWSQSWSVILLVQMKQNKIKKKKEENFTFLFCNFHLEFSCERLQFCITNVIKYSYLLIGTMFMILHINIYVSVASFANARIFDTKSRISLLI